MSIIFQRTLCVLLFFFLSGCTSVPCQRWVSQEIPGKCPDDNAARLIFVQTVQPSGFEIELTRNHQGIHLYLNLFMMHARPCPDSPCYTLATITFDDDSSWTIYPHLFAGEQRLLLPDDTTDYLVETLLEGRSFIIHLGNHELEITPANFQELYEKILKIVL